MVQKENKMNRKKTTATLLIAIFMISMFAVAIPVSAVLTTITYSGNTLDQQRIRYTEYSFDPNNVPVTLSGTITLSESMTAATMIGLIDKQTIDEGISNFHSGAYIYFGRFGNNLKIGPSDGNYDGEICSNYLPTYTDYFLDPVEVEYLVTIGNGEITVTIDTESRTIPYGIIENINNLDAYPWDEFELGAYIGIDNWPASNDIEYTISFEVDVPTKADILRDKEVPGKGIDDAPGLDELPPNDHFGGRNRKNNGHGPGPQNEPNGPNEHANDNAHKHGKE